MRPLSRLLNPRHIAVFGGNWATAVVRQTLKMGFAGPIWPVHPTRDSVEGLPAFRSVEYLPDAPDAVFIGVNREATIPIVRALAARGTGGAVCFASGFLEASLDDDKGEALQAELVAAAGAMPILGPNCYGLLNYADGAALWPDQHGGLRLPQGGRGAAIVTQSSNIAINMTMQARGLPLSYIVTAGNQAQTGLSDIAIGLVEDERVSCLGLHIEGFDSAAGFARLGMRARELHKPIVAMKMGRSEQSQAATVSHTASLAGSDAASDTFLRRCGVGRVHSIPAFLETLKLLHVAGPLPGRSISSMSCSGGEASIMADTAVGRGVAFRMLTEAHRATVKATLGPLVAVANPLDYHTFIWNNEPAMTATFSAFVGGGFDLNFLVLDFPRTDRCEDKDWRATVNAFAAACKTHGARGAVLASLPENLNEGWSADIMARGLVPLHGFDEAIAAAEAAATIGEAWAQTGGVPAGTISPPFSGRATVGANPAASLVVRRTLSEAEAKARLRAAGVPVPAGHVATTASDAVSAAREIGGAVAIKALGVAHKSEMNAVRLNLAGGEAVRDNARDLLALGNAVLVEAMVGRPVGELIAGITRDPVFGPVMTIGTGGVTVELLGDTATVLLPATRGEIEAALRGLKLFALLDGFRGRRKGDLAAALDALETIAGFAVAEADALVELDVNPLIVCEQGGGAWAADALMVVEETDNV